MAMKAKIMLQVRGGADGYCDSPCLAAPAGSAPAQRASGISIVFTAVTPPVAAWLACRARPSYGADSACRTLKMPDKNAAPKAKVECTRTAHGRRSCDHTGRFGDWMNCISVGWAMSERPARPGASQDIAARLQRAFLVVYFGSSSRRHGTLVPRKIESAFPIGA